MSNTWVPSCLPGVKNLIYSLSVIELGTKEKKRSTEVLKPITPLTCFYVYSPTTPPPPYLPPSLSPSLPPHSEF